jgi:hypothetical protein
MQLESSSAMSRTLARTGRTIQQILQGDVVEHGVGQQPLQPVFSSSNAFRRRASDTSIPPNLAFHL